MRRVLAVGLALFVALPAGIAAAALRGGGGTGADVVTVELTAHHSRFSPSSVTVPAGATVRFVVHNADPIDHELIVGPPEVHERHEVGRDAHHHGEVPGEISVPAGGTAVTVWRVPGGPLAAERSSPGSSSPGSSSPGSFVFACHLPGHFAYGMAGVLRVGG